MNRRKSNNLGPTGSVDITQIVRPSRDGAKGGMPSRGKQGDNSASYNASGGAGHVHLPPMPMTPPAEE